MKIYLASDHAGWELKEKIKKYLEDLKYEIKDFGAFKFEPEDDYPNFVHKAAEAVANDPERSRGIILGGAGQGEAVIANRFKNIRAVVCDDKENLEAKIKVWREHSNSNVLSFGARFIDEDSALKAVKLWLETPFTNEPRHLRRLEKIDKLPTS
jgi:ribose 5-phosphate isomerase B